MIMERYGDAVGQPRLGRQLQRAQMKMIKTSDRTSSCGAQPGGLPVEHHGNDLYVAKFWQPQATTSGSMRCGKIRRVKCRGGGSSAVG